MIRPGAAFSAGAGPRSPRSSFGISAMPIASVEQAIADLRNGKLIILVDDEDRENEGDFLIAAEFVTPSAINFLETQGRGLVCFVAPEERLRELGLRPLEERNTTRSGTNFYTLVDARDGTTTGISAAERSLTVHRLINPRSAAADFVRPGHLNTLGAVSGGVLKRAGHTEGAADLCRLAGLSEAAVICEVKKPDGEMARLPDLERIAKEQNLKITSIRDLIAYRWRAEKLISLEVETRIPNEFGEWRVRYYESKLSGEGHIALIMGEIDPEQETLTRVHSKCFTGDTLGSLRCDCQNQLRAAMARIAREGRGVVVYLMQEGRGIGLKNKLKAYALQDCGSDTVEANERLGFNADLREYGIGAQILADIGARKLRLLTNNPKKLAGLEGFGLTVVGREPIETELNEHNKRYMETKARKLGHLLEKLPL
jgi:3,4-dihydroxy 2-butanone 4-phosphate synthase/GTP cyclohydrolase II